MERGGRETCLARKHRYGSRKHDKKHGVMVSTPDPSVLFFHVAAVSRDLAISSFVIGSSRVPATWWNNIPYFTDAVVYRGSGRRGLNRFGSGIDGMRDIVEAAAGNQPEVRVHYYPYVCTVSSRCYFVPLETVRFRMTTMLALFRLEINGISLSV